VVSFVRAAPIATGKTIINPITKRSYTLLSKLGTGGFAIVYLADEIPEAGLEPIKVAIKITQGLIGNTEYREMAEIEALIAQELCGGSGKEGVVQVKDHFPLGDYSYATVMEVMSCDLKGLRTMLEASAKSLSVFDRVQLIYHATKQILPAIADLHERGLVQ
jgi:serine/threonine protein kinase